MKKLNWKLIILIIGAILTVGVLVVIGAESQKTKEGLVGPVKAIKVEEARFVNKFDKLQEEKRVEKANFTYDEKGNVIYRAILNENEPDIGRWEYTYDSNSNIQEVKYYNFCLEETTIYNEEAKINGNAIVSNKKLKVFEKKNDVECYIESDAYPKNNLKLKIYNLEYNIDSELVNFNEENTDLFSRSTIENYAISDGTYRNSYNWQINYRNNSEGEIEIYFDYENFRGEWVNINDDKGVIIEKDYMVGKFANFKLLITRDDKDRVVKRTLYQLYGMKTCKYNSGGELELELVYGSYKELVNSTDKIIWVYDGKGNPVEKTYFLSNQSIANKVMFVYNQKGLLTEKNAYHGNGSRYMKRVYSYNALGRLDKQVLYDEENKTMSVFDTKGNIIEKTVYRDADNIKEKIIYSYDKSDSHGNWIKQTESRQTVKLGKLVSEPVKVTYRTISYY